MYHLPYVLIDDIQRKSERSAIQEKAAAVEMMLESGKNLVGFPATIAWNFLRKAAGRLTQA